MTTQTFAPTSAAEIQPASVVASAMARVAAWLAGFGGSRRSQASSWADGARGM